MRLQKPWHLFSQYQLFYMRYPQKQTTVTCLRYRVMFSHSVAFAIQKNENLEIQDELDKKMNISWL